VCRWQKYSRAAALKRLSAPAGYALTRKRLSAPASERSQAPFGACERSSQAPFGACEL